MNVEKLVKKVKWLFGSSGVITNFPDAIMFVTTEGQITETNKKALEFFDIKENTLFNDILIDGMKLIKNAIKFKKPVLAQSEINGKTFYVELNASKVNEGFCVSIRDVTRLTNETFTKEAIERFNGEKNAMLAKLENDFTSPLSSIIGFSQGLLDGIGGELTEKQSKYIKIINSNASELHLFLDKFLEFTYAESSLYQKEVKSFDIISTIKETIKPFESIINPEQVIINFEYEDIDKRSINSDIKGFQRALTNILDVSTTTTETGYISIKLGYPDEETAMAFNLEDTKSYLQLIIKDTGSGFLPEEMKYLCDPYAQLGNSKKNFLRSLKLGSASIFIKRAMGKISITSEIMQGTIYNIILPIEKENHE